MKKTLGWINERGIQWTVLSLLRTALKPLRAARRIVSLIEARMVLIERARLLTGEGTVSSSHHTPEENRKLWDEHDWSNRGEEWSRHAELFMGIDPEVWKSRLIKEVMLEQMKPGKTILEIGPGAGRWTEELVKLGGRLILSDISKKCLDLCRERFNDHKNVEYRLIKDDYLAFLENESVDCVWSYDVFVHINPADTDRYLADLARVMAKGAVAVIHHPGSYRREEERSAAFRSHMTEKLFLRLLEKNGLKLIRQESEHVHYPGDVISVFGK